MPRLHPNIAEVYRKKVVNLGEALNEERTCVEAAECIRELIEEVRLVPKNGNLRIELYGELAALINFASNRLDLQLRGLLATVINARARRANFGSLTRLDKYRAIVRF
jgi:hypothetical protein